MPRRVRFIAVLLSAAILLTLALRPAQAADPDAPEDMAMTTMNIGKTPFSMQGFGNVDWVASALKGQHTGFENGAFDLFVTSHLDDHWSVLAELVFEPSGNEIAPDLERFEFMYEYSDAFRISAGRVHNPFLQWPITYHHGLFMQIPVQRPIMARWEDEPGLWPMHFVGILAQGRLLGGAGLNYALGVGNGRGSSLEVVQVGSDANDNKAVTASIGLNPDLLQGFEIHASTYLDRIPADTTLKETDYALSSAFVRGPLDVRGEWSQMEHKDEAHSITYRTTGWYVMGAYRLPLKGPQVRAFGLFEGIRAPGDESFLMYPTDEDAWTAGLRWDASRGVALKGAYRSSKIEGLDRDGETRLQLAVNF
ncbi:MAG: hypothetical protein ACRENS_13420, partial [Candidatus Eiseniibacteriota bacterium]